MKSLGGARRCAVAVTAAVLVGCGGSSSTGPSATGTGSLTVTVTAPAGVLPVVIVSGPSGQHTLNATATLTGLTIGTYTVTATSAGVTNAIVATVYDPQITGGTATVSAGATATASVSYAARPGTGALWVATALSPTVAGYSAGQLAASTVAAPATAVGIGSATGVFFGAAFDASGNLWLTDEGDNAVVEFASSQLAASGTPAPDVTLTSNGSSLSDPTGLAFDVDGNLWVANYAYNTLVEFKAAQLAAAGFVGGSVSPTPAVTLSPSLEQPTGIAFDAGGNLWVANAGNSTLQEFTASQLGASGAPVAARGFGAGYLNGPAGLAFDAAGNLWVANEAANGLLVLSPSQLTSGGIATGGRLLATGSSLSAPVGLAFDATGDLWVSNYLGDTVVEFTPSQLAVAAAGGSTAPTPNVVVSGRSLASPVGLAFDPPQGLALTPFPP